MSHYSEFIIKFNSKEDLGFLTMTKGHTTVSGWQN